MDATRELLNVGCTTQQQPTSTGTRSDPRSHVTRMRHVWHTLTHLVHIFYMSPNFQKRAQSLDSRKASTTF